MHYRSDMCILRSYCAQRERVDVVGMHFLPKVMHTILKVHWNEDDAFAKRLACVGCIPYYGNAYHSA